jgi:hypothetical protein
MKRIIPAAVLLLAACGQADSDPGPGGVTVGEAKALDEAAQMIDERRLPPDAAATNQPQGGAEKGQEKP